MQALIVTLHWCVTVFSYITLSLISIPWSFLHNHLSISSLGVTLKREERERKGSERERETALCLCILRKHGRIKEEGKEREKSSDPLFIILNWRIK